MVQHQAGRVTFFLEVEVEDFVKRAKALTKEIEESARFTVKRCETTPDGWNGSGDRWCNGREIMVKPPWWKVAAARDEIITTQIICFGGGDCNKLSCHKSFSEVADISHINIEWSREDKKKDMQELEEVQSPNKVGERLHKNSGTCSISSYVTLW